MCRQFAGGTAKARAALESALVMDPACTDAINALVDLDEFELRYDQGIARMKDNLQRGRVDFNARRIGDLYLVWRSLH